MSIAPAIVSFASVPVVDRITPVIAKGKMFAQSFCGEEMRTTNLSPPKLNHPGLIFKTSHSCLG
jgi:hypothetical protein